MGLDVKTRFWDSLGRYQSPTTLSATRVVRAPSLVEEAPRSVAFFLLIALFSHVQVIPQAHGCVSYSQVFHTKGFWTQKMLSDTVSGLFPPSHRQQVKEGRLVEPLCGGTTVCQRSCLALLWASCSSGVTFQALLSPAPCHPRSHSVSAAVRSWGAGVRRGSLRSCWKAGNALWPGCSCTHSVDGFEQQQQAPAPSPVLSVGFSLCCLLSSWIESFLLLKI